MSFLETLVVAVVFVIIAMFVYRFVLKPFFRGVRNGFKNEINDNGK